MPSLQSYAVSWALWFTAKSTCQSADNLNKAVRDDRRTRDPAPPQTLYNQFHIDESQQHGYTVYTLSPKLDGKPNTTTKANLLYLHGGGFIFNMTKEHWGLVAAITQRLGATVTVPIYPLGPEVKLLSIYEVVQPLYNRLAAAAAPDEPFWCGGDSAGGTMTLALTRQAIDDGLPLASRMLLISPCVDYSCSNNDLHTAAKTDPWLDVPGIKEMTCLVCPDLDTMDPRLSPLYGSLKGFPPMLVLAGGADLLTPDTKKFVDAARKEGNDVEYYFAKGMMHIWPVMPIPEATVAIEQMTKWLLRSLRDSETVDQQCSHLEGQSSDGDKNLWHRLWSTLW
ncbi:Alpha/Beta hydrolase protein [Dactylonectria macrodidyma]|uniref:Alpha/Beta hydrolase protein n=1 Tax=Dactylonectria macrodidyma TaxID=307937 RepID=A0A9P9IAN9_9HYPO|nr:Alpha/Beta hydrolase protein [Dactylonectria macrodidyma]